MLKGDSDPTAKTGWLTDGKKVTLNAKHSHHILSSSELVSSVPLYAISSAAQQTLLTYTISPDYVSEILKLSLSWILVSANRQCASLHYLKHSGPVMPRQHRCSSGSPLASQG